MNNQLYDKMKKEVIANVFGTTIGIRLQGNSPILFKQFYFDSITNYEERGLICRILLEILSIQSGPTSYKLRCYAAYIASDIGLKDATPFVEQLASEKAIQKSSYMLLLERALEKAESDYMFSREQMKHIIICQIKGKHHDVHTRGEILYDFKEEYFERSSLQKKEMIRQAIMDILITDSTYLNWKRLRCYAAYIASDIKLMIAKPVIEKMSANECFKKSKDYGVLLRALDKFNSAQC
jgi:hypothetical protein